MRRTLSLWRNRLIVMVVDASSVCLAFILACFFRFSFEQNPVCSTLYLVYVLLGFLIIQQVLFFLFGLYRGVFRFASVADLLRIIKASLAGAFCLALLVLPLAHFALIPRATPILYFVFVIFLMGSSRLGYRVLRTDSNMPQAQSVLIIGAGDAGEGLARDLLRHAAKKYRPIGFLDDHPIKKGRDLHGVRVLGKISDIEAVAKAWQIDHIFIAIPSLSNQEMRQIFDLCLKIDLPYSTLPRLHELSSSQVNVGQIRRVSLEDLIGREEIRVDTSGLDALLHDTVVMVTGGGGSIGSELCRQIAQFALKKLIIIDHSEFNLYQIDQELHAMQNQVQYELVLGSVTDVGHMQQVFERYRPKIVLHAAAYKHVPILESQQDIALKNNVLGTKVMADLAVQHKIQKFVLISTDKAVNPTNIMGASKRVGEVYCQLLAGQQAATQFMVVRFGNVINSAGSVVPLFHKQIEAGGPVTITHPEITRYFMTVSEASRLILQAACLGKGGEVFVLDMGEPIAIQYLAERLIQFAGKEVGRDIEIVYTGLRPGEKMYEELFYSSENLVKTQHKKIMRSVSPYEAVQPMLEPMYALFALLEQGEPFSRIKLRETLLQIVQEYQACP